MFDSLPMLPVGKILCVGRNYADHARELNNPIPESPIYFMKPATAAVPFGQTIQLQSVRGVHHYECELALLIGQQLSQAAPEAVNESIQAVGLGLDLTLRDLQTQLKNKGHPWEKAKAFDGACPLSDWVPMSELFDGNPAVAWGDVSFTFSINDEIRQRGNPSNMLFDIPHLVSEMSCWFSLNPGDIVLTGTPKGVGVLKEADQLVASLSVRGSEQLKVATQVHYLD